MTCVRVGVPPGFVPDIMALEELVRSKTVDRFETGARFVTLYLGETEGGKSVSLKVPMRARLPFKGLAPECIAWEYYAPDGRDEFPPVAIEVTAP
ncbi:MAG: hypothetical protein AAB074_09480 [Planctomycetota bacterium]